ncbi:site-specific DNA-methyltransferase [Porphyromonas gingivalis]|uniref:site-specific DNA-methyltransferase n=1 Tax=Porphyromonas gingivalis TaxID=837 RepID=UPI001C52BC29|nr:site-specific DNA-methyltransferase [Porphyromonas gingivalis]
MDNLEQQTTYDMKQRLELTWIGKGEEDVLEPRILIENPEYSYGDSDTGNLLIHGDNLLALRSLVASGYAGKVKCIYIDPPYNTGSAFTHYDDMQEHSIWLGLMQQRIRILYELLADDGTLWISLDDEEQAYARVLCDEIFGRQNFVANVIWHKKHTRSNDAKWFSDNHDFILVYAKDKASWRPNLLPRSEDSLSNYTNPDNDPRGVWASGPCHVKTPNPKDIYPIITPSGREVLPPNGTSWRFSQDKMAELIQDNRIYFGKEGANIPRYKRFLTEVQDGFVPTTLWFREEVGDNQEAKKEVKGINSKDVFSTPKPERLIERVLTLASNDGDLVLDSFLGSGTTAAVAHKMGRRYIGIELGDHAYTHCVPRLKKVIDGTDQGGITASTGWAGGGGFRFCELAPTLLNEDEHGVMVISPEYNAEMLAAAMALHEGFRYAPDAEVFWKQGHSTESDYIYTTTQHLTIETLQYIDSLLGEGETLLICCTSHGAGLGSRFPRITVKRIPRMLLGRCAFDPAKSYDLNIITLPEVEPQDEDDDE